MKGDIILLSEHHIHAAKVIASLISDKINKKPTRYVITVAGESGSGKSETAQAISNELEKSGISSIILGQDDYFYLPPKSNSEKRRADRNWLGPHMEVNFPVFEQNLIDAIHSSDKIIKPLIDYNANSVGSETVSLKCVKVVIAEGTYTSLLKHVDLKIFITRNWITTLGDRKKRNRGNEVDDPFTENILATEHKIIAGHKQLADFIINDDFEVINLELEI
jgi:uridine kinase